MVDRHDFWTSTTIAAASLGVMLPTILSPWQGLKDSYRILLIAGPVAMATLAYFGLLKEQLAEEHRLRQTAERNLAELRRALKAEPALAQAGTREVLPAAVAPTAADAVAVIDEPPAASEGELPTAETDAPRPVTEQPVAATSEAPSARAANPVAQV